MSLDLYGNDVLYSVPSSTSSFTGYAANPAAIQSFGPNGLPTTGAPASLTGFPQNFPTTVTYRYSLDTQYDLGHNWVASLGYQGSQTRHYTLQNNLNLIYYPNLNPRVQSVSWFTNDANAHFNALLTELQHRFANTFEIDAQYRFSRSIDDGSQDYYQDPYPFNLKYSVGPSDFDVTHNFKLWGVWTPTLFRSGHNWGERILGDWSISAILTLHSGFPWTPQYCNTGGNVLYTNSNQSCVYPSSYSGGALDYSSNPIYQYLSNFPKGALSYFTIPNYTGTISTPGITRNSFRGPGYFGNDFTLSKAFGLPGGGFLHENAKVVLQANFYNLFNKLNLLNVNDTSLNGGADAYISNDGIASNPRFGLSPGALAGRIIELQAKFNF